MSNDRKPFPQSRRLVKSDGTVAMTWDNKLHNWEGPALITPEGKKNITYMVLNTHLMIGKNEEDNVKVYRGIKIHNFRGTTRF
jgi:hypothetical protein